MSTLLTGPRTIVEAFAESLDSRYKNKLIRFIRR
jgi:hypothetical protein